METLDGQEKSPDDVAGLQTSNEIVKLIRKLRWMGLENEAETLEKQLTLCAVTAGDSVVAASRDTD